jgi:predicted protein tyrosine phosphatase
MHTPTPPLLSYHLTICGLAELTGHAARGVSHVLSILDPTWPEPEAFDAYEVHERVVLRFDDIVGARDGARAPAETDVAAILDLGERLDHAASHLLIHCHAGISRSTAAAIILMARANPGREREIFRELKRLRPKSWPNALMLEFADRLLGRDGALIAPLKAHQRQIIAEFPEFAAMLRQSDRAHEVTALDGDDLNWPTLTQLAAPPR